WGRNRMLKKLIFGIAGEKQSIDDLSLGIEDLKWDIDNPHDSIKELYQRTVQFARSKVRFYYNDAEDNRRWSTRLRLSGFVVLTIGAIFPLVEATGVLSASRLGQWGYIVLALGGALTYADQLLGTSASWVRSTVTWLSLRKDLAAFQYD